MFLRSALERRAGNNSDSSVFYKKDKKVFLKRQVALKRRRNTFWVVKNKCENERRVIFKAMFKR